MVHLAACPKGAPGFLRRRLLKFVALDAQFAAPEFGWLGGEGRAKPAQRMRDTPMTRVYLIRHGEPRSAWGGEDPDPGLDEQGWVEAETEAH